MPAIIRKWYLVFFILVLFKGLINLGDLLPLVLIPFHWEDA